MSVKKGDTVVYTNTTLDREPKGTCLFDWAWDYCLEDEEYEVIEISEMGDLRIKGKLNTKMPAGKYPDEIWVNSNQFALTAPATDTDKSC